MEESDIKPETPPTPLTHNASIFPFFALPRELRDEIYILSLLSFEKQLPSNLQVRATNTTPLNLLLISHQFSHELTSLTTKTSHLLIHDHWDYTTRCNPTPTVLTTLPPVSHLQLFIYFGVLNREQLGLWGFVSKAAKRMPNLKTVRVRILTDSISDRWGRRGRKLLEGFFGKLGRFWSLEGEVVRDCGKYEGEEEFWDPDREEGREVIWRWNVERKRLIWVGEEEEEQEEEQEG